MLGHNSDDDPTAFGLGLGTRPTRDQVELMRDRKTLELESALLKTRNDRAGDPTHCLPVDIDTSSIIHTFFLSFFLTFLCYALHHPMVEQLLLPMDCPSCPKPANVYCNRYPFNCRYTCTKKKLYNLSRPS